MGAANAEYLHQVRSAAEGAPIQIRTDISFDELRRLYGESAIYWHATGFGEDPTRHPLRFEHFGLTTVEAMAAGAVPVVIDGGGQPEIVTHGVDGFLWSSIDELKSHTQHLIERADLCHALRIAARERSHTFGQAAFEKRVWEVIDI